MEEVVRNGRASRIIDAQPLKVVSREKHRAGKAPAVGAKGRPAIGTPGRADDMPRVDPKEKKGGHCLHVQRTENWNTWRQKTEADTAALPFCHILGRPLAAAVTAKGRFPRGKQTHSQQIPHLLTWPSTWPISVVRRCLRLPVYRGAAWGPHVARIPLSRPFSLLLFLDIFYHCF